jgi:hypothetical protein
MKRYIMLLAAAVMLLIVLPVAPVAASPPLDATIELDIQNDPPSEHFVATGPAVDAGLVCASGDAVDISELLVGGRSGSHLNIHIVKEFRCADESGTFILSFQAVVDFASGTATGNWNVHEGTGDYEKLHGTGKMVATLTGTGIEDVFTGKMHVD